MKGIRKGLYAKRNKQTPTFYVPLLEREEFVSIYTNTKRNGLPYVFEEMRAILEERGLSPYQAALQSKDARELFTEACISLSSKRVYPFYYRLKPIDTSKVLTTY